MIVWEEALEASHTVPRTSYGGGGGGGGRDPL